MTNTMSIIRIAVFSTAAAAFASIAGAHHDRIAQLTAESSEKAATVDNATDTGKSTTVADRQIAFFESEMLLHLARFAPAPSQDDAIDLAYADHQLVAKAPGRPEHAGLRDMRHDLHEKLREDYFFCEVDWPNLSSAPMSGDRVELAEGGAATCIAEYFQLDR